MTTFKIWMKPNERIYVNGAVMKFDRKTSLEFLNDVQFLLESHVMQADDADTPLKRLYFFVQLHLISPSNIHESRKAFQEQLNALLSTFDDRYVLNELKNVDRMVKEDRFYEAMKSLRPLFPLEDRLLKEITTSFPFDKTERPLVAAG